MKDYLQRTDYFSDAGTVEGLAKFMKVSATSLGYTIRQVNHAAAGWKSENESVEFSHRRAQE